LYEFLYGWLSSTLGRADKLHESFSEQSSKESKNNRKKKEKKKLKQRPHARQAQLSRALQELCGGFYKTVSALKIEKKLRQPLAAMNTEQTRYEHRFAPFNNVLAPPAVSYGQFKVMGKELHESQDGSQLYRAASDCFTQAKALLEEMSEPDDEITSYLKVAKTNLVVTKLLSTGQVKGAKEFPEFDFSVNKDFPILRIL
jgi:hypothetical protein